MKGTGQLNSYKVFVDFSTLEHPFNLVRYQEVSGPDLHAVGEPRYMALDQANFKFVVSVETGERKVISVLEIEV